MKGLAVTLTVVATLVLPAQALAGTDCFYKDPTPAKAEFVWKAIACWQYTHWWVNGAGVKTLVWINSTAARFQMTGRNLNPRALVDWDPATGGVFPVPAGYWVDVY